MKLEEIFKQPERKTLKFKKEIPKNKQNLLETVVAMADLTFHVIRYRDA